MADKSAKHPNGTHTIYFREQYHTYIDNHGSRYISGTSFAKPFFKKFDAVAISKKCAAGSNPKYAGRNPADIRAEWTKEGQRGSMEGDNVHEYAEFWASPPGESIKPISERCALLFKQVDVAYRVLLAKKFIPIENEKIIFSPSMGVAGTIDFLMLDSATGNILILDWKTNKNPLSTENPYQSGLPPIDHLQETDINKYSLQLSIYQYILIKENYFPEATGFRRILMHITPTKMIPIKLEYFDYEINVIMEIMQCQKKQNR